MAETISQDDLNALFGGLSLSVEEGESAPDPEPVTPGEVVESLSQDDIDKLLEMYGK